MDIDLVSAIVPRAEIRKKYPYIESKKDLYREKFNMMMAKPAPKEAASE